MWESKTRLVAARRQWRQCVHRGQQSVRLSPEYVCPSTAGFSSNYLKYPMYHTFTWTPQQQIIAQMNTCNVITVTAFESFPLKPVCLCAAPVNVWPSRLAYCCELSFRPNLLLAAAAWPYVLLSESRDSVMNSTGEQLTDLYTSDVEYWSYEMVNWELTFCCYVYVVLVSVRTSVDAISTLQPGRCWPLVFTASCTVVTGMSQSVDHKWPPSSRRSESFMSVRMP